MSYLFAKVESIGNTSKEVESVGQIVGIHGNDAHIIWDKGEMKGYSSNYNLHMLLINNHKYRITRMSNDDYVSQSN